MATGNVERPNFINVYTDISQLTSTPKTATTNDIYQAMSSWSIAMFRASDTTYIYKNELSGGIAWADIILVKFKDKWDGFGFAKPYNTKTAYIFRLSSGATGGWEQISLV